MYTGYWTPGSTYNRGDIVYCTSGYYVCVLNHVSDNLTFPNPEDIHWIALSPDIFTNPIFCTSGSLIESSRHFGPSLTREPVLTQSEPILTTIPLTASKQKSKLKRKLEDIESQIDSHKKRSRVEADVSDLRDQLLLLKLDIPTKAYILEKHDNAKKAGNSDYSKTITWLKTVAKLPFNKHKRFPVTAESDPNELTEFFDDVKAKLDKHILGLEPVKQEILQFLARKITNPNGKGHVLALCGQKGVGKTKIIRSLAEALQLPFYQINFGGLNDVNVLTGHSETYVGSKPGKIADILCHAGYMNPIMYLDEIDKMSESKSQELNGILTHLLDEEQNDKFQDNYLGNVTLNLSKVFFVIAFNDITKVDEIVSDRMTTIYVSPPSFDEKLQIAKTKVIPEIVSSVNMQRNVCIPDDVIRHVMSYTLDDPGVRQLKKNIEKVIYKLNYDTLVCGNNLPNGLTLEQTSSRRSRTKTTVIVSQDYVDRVISKKETDTSYLSMYT